MNMQPTSRRALLKGSAILIAAPIAPTAAAPVLPMMGEPEPIPPETPIMRIYRQWEVLLEETEAAWCAVKEQGADAEDAIFEDREPERRRIEEALLAESATDLRDLAAKMLILSGEGCWALPDAVTLECAALVGRDTGKMPRCLFEGSA